MYFQQIGRYPTHSKTETVRLGAGLDTATATNQDIQQLREPDRGSAPAGLIVAQEKGGLADPPGAPPRGSPKKRPTLPSFENNAARAKTSLARYPRFLAHKFRACLGCTLLLTCGSLVTQTNTRTKRRLPIRSDPRALLFEERFWYVWHFLLQSYPPHPIPVYAHTLLPHTFV